MCFLLCFCFIYLLCNLFFYVLVLCWCVFLSQKTDFKLWEPRNASGFVATFILTDNRNKSFSSFSYFCLFTVNSKIMLVWCAYLRNQNTPLFSWKTRCNEVIKTVQREQMLLRNMLHIRKWHINENNISNYFRISLRKFYRSRKPLKNTKLCSSENCDRNQKAAEIGGFSQRFTFVDSQCCMLTMSIYHKNIILWR